jgi:hypothetical protein
MLNPIVQNNINHIHSDNSIQSLPSSNQDFDLEDLSTIGKRIFANSTILILFANTHS